MPNKPAHPTAGNVSIRIRASIPAVDGLFVRQKIMIKKSQKIIAAEEPINFRIAMSITVCIIGVVSSFFSIAFGLTILGGGVLGLIANLWARSNRDSPWVTGMENSSSPASSDPRIVKILDGARAHKMKDKQPRVDQAHEYKKLLDSGLILQHDYQVAMKSLFPHLPSPGQQGEQAGTEQPATRPQSKSEDSDKPQPESEGRSR